jgi:hypothetical protein
MNLNIDEKEKFIERERFVENVGTLEVGLEVKYSARNVSDLRGAIVDTNEVLMTEEYERKRFHQNIDENALHYRVRRFI